ncbi:MAG: GNAT family N-acetyltransferase [Candidatus Latescibacteria bacterium]|nr:GNAT family N-acetyltransferase [Candidatus Latescibacterota bacterium]NIO27252.1 GNAT family N-acetyltransferase [Candidatus Latescibacterota bacterium]NIO54776.1 GNAT family N-acetyltransferase [Candidatus Latescibacterota bacterium]NIT00859.1 GNAT family N-acetyltransferase [Candidatus Latescibacterota bacterium]NIT37782.1 GNAT family N-acetyltransferase [Candidatus Latescibacterota bacterium]
MRVLEDNQETRERYSRIYKTSETATVYQSPEWLRVLESLRGELIFLEIDENSLIPFICKGRGRLKRCYSLSFDTYGGPVSRSSPNVSFEEVVHALKIPSVRMVDFSHIMVDRSNSAIEFHAHIMDLTGGIERVTKAYTKKNREALRQSARRGIQIEKMNDPKLLPVFYALVSHAARRHRTVPHPMPLLRQIYKIMVPKNMASFYFARHENKAVACNLILRDKKTAYDWLLGYKEEFLQLRPANALIDRAVRNEIDIGCEAFNLGTSPFEHRGIIKFKESFGAKPYPYRVFFKAGLSYSVMRKLKSRALRLGPGKPAKNSNGVDE